MSQQDLPAIIERPLPNTYWVVPGKLLAGKHPGSTDPKLTQHNLQRLREAGIRVLVDLTEPGAWDYHSLLTITETTLLNQTLRYERIGYPDDSVPSIAQMRYILDTIDRALDANQPVFVHCQAGMGRTGTVVGCYLVRHGMSGEEVLDEIARLRGDLNNVIQSPRPGRQQAMVLNWKAGQ